MRQGRGRTSHLCQPHRQIGAPFACPTCPLSAFVGRATGSQCASPHGWTGDDQTVRHPRRLCPLARFGDGLTRSCQPLGSFFSDKLASPRGASWPLFLAIPHFFLSAAFFALHPAVSTISHGLNFRFLATI